jgi:uracil-DNA glycosylase
MEINLQSDWKEHLHEEFKKTYFKNLMAFVDEEYSHFPDAIFPKKEDVFNAFNVCALSNVRVVILGQDPYPTRGHAHGLSFSVQEEVKPFPKSLKNIFKELERDLAIPFPENGNLLRWANQGVLLLNATLTVCEGKPESHANKGWEKFTDFVLQKLMSERRNVVYLLWGSKAQSKADFINSNDNLVLKAPHPSPLSAHRGFFGCKHFSLANEYLKETGGEVIQW